MHTDVNKGTESGDVGDNAFQHHVRLQVADRLDTLLEFSKAEFRAWIAARFLQFGDDVFHGQQARLFGHKLLGIHGFQSIPVTNQGGDILLQLLRHSSDHRVGFRVNRRAIQRVAAIHNAQKSCGLLEGFRAQTRDFQQRLAAVKGAVVIPETNDVIGQRLVQTGNTAQQGRGSGVQIHTD